MIHQKLFNIIGNEALYNKKKVSVYRNIDTWTSTGTDKKTAFTNSEEAKSCQKIPIFKKNMFKK